MDATKNDLSRIFSGSTVYEIPFYQRGYVWDKEQWERLIEDVEYVTLNSKPYFLGSVINKQQTTKTGASYNKRLVIDGQQRFTTLMILFKVISLKSDQQSVKDQFKAKFCVFDYAQNDYIFCVRHSLRDRNDFELVLSQTEGNPLSEEKRGKIVSAYNYFLSRVNPEKVNFFTLLSKLELVCIDLQEDDDEQVIFDTINSLGVQLTTGELLKNYFYREDNRNDYEIQWRPIFEKDAETIAYWDSKATIGRAKRSNIETFFQAYFSILVQNPIYEVSSDDKFRFKRATGLFNNFKDCIKSYSMDKSAIAHDIVEYARIFHDNINPDVSKADLPGTSGIERINFILFHLDCSTMLPYILFLLKNVTDKNELNKMFGFLESYLVRRIICKFPNKNYSDFFNEHLIGNNIMTYDSLKEYIYSKGEERDLSLPTDEKFHQAFLNIDQPNGRASAILYLLETFMREGKPYNSKMKPYCEFTLEHLMPRKWHTNWPLPVDKTDTERDRLILTLGNLALLNGVVNTSISNAAWTLKVAGDEKHYGIIEYGASVTLGSFVNSPYWNEEKIRERGEWLYQNSLRLWPYDSYQQQLILE